jgi:hypothetical protein
MPGRSFAKLGVLIIVMALAATACGSSNETESTAPGTLLPFAMVQDTEFVFEADPTDPNKGIFRVKTTEPMICTIVWGETEEFGNFNNSLAMNGTGIIDHDVILPGAHSGTTYFFRLQGSTADGNQFRSETGTFTIPEPEDGLASDDHMSDDDMALHGPNLAIGTAVLDTSSVFGNGWKAENAVDDDTNTEWATLGDGDSGFITIDLGSTHEVVGVEFLTRSMLDGTATTETYTVTVDGGEPLGPFPAGNPAEPRFSPIQFSGREIRFDVSSSSGGNVGAIEVKVFAPAG